MHFDHLRSYVVCINGGSGVIFQPLDANYSYVLTAKHVFDDLAKFNNQVNLQYYDNDKTYKSLPLFSLIVGENYFPHPIEEVDVALIKISRLLTADDLMIKEDIVNDNKGYILGGYPNVRRKNNELVNLDSIRFDLEVTLMQESERYQREADVSKNATLEELEGSSGGGFFKIEQGRAYLAGLQCRMAADKERMGRIKFSPVDTFADIILGYPILLEALVPYYMKAFGVLKDDVFRLPTALHTQEIIDKILLILKQKTEGVINGDFKPVCIQEQLGNKRLLIAGQQDEMVYLKKLWVMWLELMVIIGIAKGKDIKKSDLAQLFTEVRLFYSTTEKDFWVAHLDDIAKTDFTDLQQGGLVVVCSEKLPHNDFYILDKEAIVDQIDRVRTTYNAGRLDFTYGDAGDDIAVSSDFPYDKYQFVHLGYFKQKFIVDEFADFKHKSLQEMLLTLKNKYEQLIRS